jgi:stage IV sporulation protein FB
VPHVCARWKDIQAHCETAKDGLPAPRSVRVTRAESAPMAGRPDPPVAVQGLELKRRALVVIQDIKRGARHRSGDVMFDTGYLRLFSWRGASVRVHWTLPLGAIVFGGGSIAPAFWLGFVLLVALHEFGHAAVALRMKQHVVAIDITGFGGMCRWTGTATPIQRSLIAWGGILVQAMLLLAALALVALVPGVLHGWTGEFVSVFLWTNLWLIALNLLPFPPLDGAHAWRLMGELRRSDAIRALQRAMPARGLRDGWFSRAGAARRAIRWPWSRTSKPTAACASPPSDRCRPANASDRRSASTDDFAGFLRNIGDQARDARTKSRRPWN